VVLQSHDAATKRQAIRQARTFVIDHADALKVGADFLDRAGPLSALPADSPMRAGLPVVRTSMVTGGRSLGRLGAPCDYLLAEHDRIAAEHHFTRVVAMAPDPVMSVGLLQRWSHLETYLQTCVDHDDSAMATAADALADDLPNFRAARAAYSAYLLRS
jgi:hypothetical protein